MIKNFIKAKNIKILEKTSFLNFKHKLTIT